jgi:hypothetical protein
MPLALSQFVAQPVFFTDGAFSVLLGRNITTTVTFEIPEVLRPLGGLRNFKPEFHFNVFLKGLTHILCNPCATKCSKLKNKQL